MSRKAKCWYNAPVESFFATLKGELVDARDCLTRDEARADVFQYVEDFYNVLSAVNRLWLSWRGCALMSAHRSTA